MANFRSVVLALAAIVIRSAYGQEVGAQQPIEGVDHSDSVPDGQPVYIYGVPIQPNLGPDEDDNVMLIKPRPGEGVGPGGPIQKSPDMAGKPRKGKGGGGTTGRPAEGRAIDNGNGGGDGAAAADTTPGSGGGESGGGEETTTSGESGQNEGGSTEGGGGGEATTEGGGETTAGGESDAATSPSKR